MVTGASSGKPVVLIVGAGDFIGAAIARRFSAEGYIVCMGRRNGDKLAPLVEEIGKTGGEAHGFTLDAREEEQVVEVFDRIESDVGPIDTMIFNPGGNVNFPIRDTTSRVFRKVWEMACLGGFLCGREAANRMVPRGRGSIFFTGATASMRGGSGYAAFASAKAGLRLMAQSLARELGPQNIHVAHLVIDAGVDTSWVRGMIAKSQGKEQAEIPPDVLMMPDSVANAYWMLQQQPRDAWTFELEIRPFGEKW
jgi:NAD(P)-dependent dehydrogenase (short-subunit alcohol dehydrogenase family)